jgi:hypothetical protein
MNNSVKKLVGTYDSGSGKVLNFLMERLPPSPGEVDGGAIVDFGEGLSRTISKLALRTKRGVEGMIFFVSSAEFKEFKNNVLGTGKQWEVNNQAGEKVTIPGVWNTVSGGRRTKTRKSRRSRTRSRR